MECISVHEKANMVFRSVSNTTWARTRNLRAPPFIATARNMAAHHARESIVIDMSDMSNPLENKKPETLFGPSIGVVQTAPAWTDFLDKKPNNHQLTPEDVKVWVKNSKEVCHRWKWSSCFLKSSYRIRTQRRLYRLWST